MLLAFEIFSMIFIMTSSMRSLHDIVSKIFENYILFDYISISIHVV